jgi:agmatinase
MRKFLTNEFSINEANVIVFGVPLGKNSKKALRILRNTSYWVEPYDVNKKRNLLENVRIVDIGDLELKSLNEINKQVEKIIAKNKIPLILGGGHLLTYYSLQKLPEKTRILIFDAHADSKDEYLDKKIENLSKLKGKKVSSKINDATWLRRFIELGKRRIALLGLRSCEKEEINFLRKNEVLLFTSQEIKKSSEIVKFKLKDFLRDFPIYISIDLDVFDPSIAPGVEHPEPNGILFEDFSNLMSIVNNKLLGFDLVCFKPLPNNEITQFLVIKVIFEILGLIR